MCLITFQKRKEKSTLRCYSIGQYHMGIINKLFRSYSSIGYHMGITNELFWVSKWVSKTNYSGHPGYHMGVRVIRSKARQTQHQNPEFGHT